jgi:hypothetical protein
MHDSVNKSDDELKDSWLYVENSGLAYLIILALLIPLRITYPKTTFSSLRVQANFSQAFHYLLGNVYLAATA